MLLLSFFVPLLFRSFHGIRSHDLPDWNFMLYHLSRHSSPSLRFNFQSKKGVRRSNNWRPHEARKVELKSLKSIRKECWRKRQKIFSCNSGSRFFPKKENYLREKDARLKILISFEIVISLLPSDVSHFEFFFLSFSLFLHYFSSTFNPIGLQLFPVFLCFPFVTIRYFFLYLPISLSLTL